MNFVLPERWLTQPINVKIAGAGGTGSQVVDQIASLDSLMRQLGHPGMHITLYDGDDVSRWNLGRQRFAAPDVGLNKAVVLAHRIALFYGTNITPVALPLTTPQCHADLLITCTDSAGFRTHLGRAYAKQRTDTLWLDFGNGDKSAQAILGHLGQPSAGERLPNVYDLFPQLADMVAADRQAPSCSMEEAVRRQPWPANRSVAIAGISMLERLLRHGVLTYHGSLIELDPYAVVPLSIDPVTWAMYGYQASSPAKRKRAA